MSVGDPGPGRALAAASSRAVVDASSFQVVGASSFLEVASFLAVEDASSLQVVEASSSFRAAASFQAAGRLLRIKMNWIVIGTYFYAKRKWNCAAELNNSTVQARNHSKNMQRTEWRRMERSVMLLHTQKAIPSPKLQQKRGCSHLAEPAMHTRDTGLRSVGACG